MEYIDTQYLKNDNEMLRDIFSKCISKFDLCFVISGTRFQRL